MKYGRGETVDVGNEAGIGPCLSFPDQAGLLMGVLAYSLLPMLRQFYFRGEVAKRWIGRLIKRLIKVGAKVANHGRRWLVHVASAFSLARQYQAVFR